MTSMATPDSTFAAWINKRQRLREQRNELRERAHGILVPIATRWSEEREGNDPITGRRIFTLSVDETKVERVAPNMMLRRISIASFNGVTFTISIPDDAIAIIVETLSNEGVPTNRTRYDDVAKSMPNSYTPDPVLNRKTGATTTAHDRFADLLSRFEREALPQ
jgi:hypothetical protein